MNNNLNHKHIIALDGLRGMAVLFVMIYHFNFIDKISHTVPDNIFNYIISAGWIGVDLFFVLSGFLITGILISNKGKSNYFISFYYRRTLRIFPLYYLYLILLFVFFYPFIVSRVDAVEVQKIHFTQSIQVWFWTYLSNIKQGIDGTFSTAGSSHLWSLAIEEQFYLIWPFIVFITSVKQLKNISIIVIILSLLLRIYLYFIGWSAQSIYIFTFTRIDSLAFGSLIATLIRSGYVIPYKKFTYVFYGLLICLLIIFCFFDTDYHRSPIIYLFSFTLLGATFGVLVLLLQSSDSFKFPLKSIFLKRGLVFLGKYSYALYIFHPFVRFALAKVMGRPKLFYNSEILWQLFFFALCFLLSIIIAQLSWHLYEKHFLKLKDRFFLKR
ncbi:acyltransferase family protein [Mucilaginibacter sp. E4BP6]|uniref:acyltransferase family protein n=1 Tax=Mucilaginibacter sp. E4BP6 TaxID=2723089 RepID=UPI0015CA1175|nr:acyltransferase [Mucilaginibacter sp. E4BP6]NYE68279.1 peptidoglycan/LPS O-acetylase OafA/YrhL [Mucilaginibacter sp. E4BP6]